MAWHYEGLPGDRSPGFWGRGSLQFHSTEFIQKHTACNLKPYATHNSRCGTLDPRRVSRYYQALSGAMWGRGPALRDLGSLQLHSHVFLFQSHTACSVKPYEYQHLRCGTLVPRRVVRHYQSLPGAMWDRFPALRVLGSLQLHSDNFIKKTHRL